jgi:hypothetical protein
MTIAVDFDGVVHAYSRGWADGSIYDPPLPGALDALRTLMGQHAVFIHTTRDRHQVVDWLQGRGLEAVADSPVTSRVFWDERGRLLVTDRKYPAVAYIDDRAVRFDNWDQALADLDRFLDRVGPRPAVQRRRSSLPDPPNTRPYRAGHEPGPERRTRTDDGYIQRWRQVGWWGQTGAFYALDEKPTDHEPGSITPLWALIDNDPAVTDDSSEAACR